MAKYYRQKVVYVDDFNRAWHEVFVCSSKEELAKKFYDNIPPGCVGYGWEVEEIDEVEGRIESSKIKH